MIIIQNKQDCCGCGACAQRCPQSCIKMTEDEEGFLYPQINIAACTNCNLCTKVCPIINKATTKAPIYSYAAMNVNEKIRLQSSSGGLFSAFSEAILSQGGIVFGAKFNQNWEVIHDYTQTIDDLDKFRGSKYAQSIIGNCYSQVEKFLKADKIVLFSGTPCQISGLKHFLRKEYDNLITIEILCYGVPSPLAWKSYLHSIPYDKSSITSINFRDKSTGWKNYSFSVECSDKRKYSQVSHNNIYMYGFLKNLYLRPSCKSCPAKLGRSGSDLSIGDCWEIQNIIPEIDDNKGINIVLINTLKGEKLYKSISIKIKSYNINYQDISKYNGGFNESIQFHPKRKEFFNEIRKGKKFVETIKKLTQTSIYQKIKSFFSYKISCFLISNKNHIHNF